MAEEETGAKITRKMQTDKTGVNAADPAENKPRHILLKLNSNEMK